MRRYLWILYCGALSIPPTPGQTSFPLALLLLGDQQCQPPASKGCETWRQPSTNCTCTGIHIQAAGQRKPHLMAGLQQETVFSAMGATNLAFLAAQGCSMVLKGKPALSSWSCNNITEHMLCDMANYPLFPPLNTTFYSFQETFKVWKANRSFKLETEKHFSFSHFSLSMQPALKFCLLHCAFSPHK